MLEHVLVHGSRAENSLSLDDSVRTGSRLDLPARALPASVSVVPQAVIQLRGARTALEAIESAVGMTGGTAVGSIPNYATRGFSGSDVTIMRDGIRQNTASQSSRPLDSFLFDRIEVLKGPASLLYGEGAIGGAVNYVSKLPTPAFYGEANVSAGYWDSYRVGVGVGGPTGLDNLSYRADVSFNQSGGYVDGSDSDYQGFAGSLLWEPTEKTRVILSGTYLDEDVQSYYGTPVIYDAVIDLDGVQSVRKASTATDTLVNTRIADGTRDDNYNNRDNFARSENSFWRAIVETELAHHWSLRNETYLATQILDWRNTERSVWNPVTQLVDRSSFFLIYRNDVQVGNRLDLTSDGQLFGRNNQLVVGALYDNNDQDRNSGQRYPGSPLPASVPLHGFERGVGPAVEPVRTLKVVTETAAFYVENVFEATDSLKLIGGLRYEEIDVERDSLTGAETYRKTFYPTTGRVGVVYFVIPEVNIYASYSRAAQPVAQLASLAPSSDEFSLQKGVQYEVGAKATLWRGRADLTVALFDIEKQDLLTEEIYYGRRIRSQVGAQVSQGAEIALALNLGAGWRLDLNYARTWQAEYEEFFENLGTGVISRTGNTPTNVPKTVAGAFVAKELGNWLGTVGVQHVGERPANNNNGIWLDAYTTVDAGLGYMWDAVTVTLRGRNLTDEEYAEWASGGGLMQRLAEPRSAEIGLSYRF